MRARDVRAIAFSVATTLGLFGGAALLTGNFLVSLALTAAYDAWLLTRPRMLRVLRRLRGEPDWGGYFDNEGVRLRPKSEPGRSASPPRPAERP